MLEFQTNFKYHNLVSPALLHSQRLCIRGHLGDLLILFLLLLGSISENDPTYYPGVTVCLSVCHIFGMNCAKAIGWNEMLFNKKLILVIAFLLYI